MIQFATDNRAGFQSPKIAKVFCNGVDVTNVCTAFDPDLGICNVLEWEGYPAAPPARNRKLVVKDGRLRRRLLRGEICILRSV